MADSSTFGLPIYVVAFLRQMEPHGERLKWNIAEGSHKITLSLTWNFQQSHHHHHHQLNHPSSSSSSSSGTRQVKDGLWARLQRTLRLGGGDNSPPDGDDPLRRTAKIGGGVFGTSSLPAELTDFLRRSASERVRAKQQHSTHQFLILRHHHHQSDSVTNSTTWHRKFGNHNNGSSDGTGDGSGNGAGGSWSEVIRDLRRKRKRLQSSQSLPERSSGSSPPCSPPPPSSIVVGGSVRRYVPPPVRSMTVGGSGGYGRYVDEPLAGSVGGSGGGGSGGGGDGGGGYTCRTVPSPSGTLYRTTAAGSALKRFSWPRLDLQSVGRCASGRDGGGGGVESSSGGYGRFVGRQDGGGGSGVPGGTATIYTDTFDNISSDDLMDDDFSPDYIDCIVTAGRQHQPRWAASAASRSIAAATPAIVIHGTSAETVGDLTTPPSDGSAQTATSGGWGAFQFAAAAAAAGVGTMQAVASPGDGDVNQTVLRCLDSCDKILFRHSTTIT